MNNIDRIIRYIDEQMTTDEKSRFEEELKNSAVLQDELKNHQIFLNNFNEVKNIPVGEDYFVNLLPKVREKISSRKKIKLYRALGYGLVSVIIIILISMFMFRNGDKIPQAEDVVSTLSDNETENILNNYSNSDISLEMVDNNSENYDSVLTDLLAENLVSENSDLNYINENTEVNFYDITGQITDSQAEIIYNELINKKFF